MCGNIYAELMYKYGGFMIDVNFYQNLIADYNIEIKLLSEKKDRLDEAYNSLSKLLGGEFFDVRSDMSAFISKLDEDNETKDWEGQRVIDIRDFMTNNVEIPINTLYKEYQLVLNEMSIKSADIGNQIEHYRELIAHYQSLIDAEI